MDYKTFHSICLRLPKVTEATKPDNEQWFLGNGHPFCIVYGKEGTGGVAFQVRQNQYNDYIADDRYKPASLDDQPNWIWVSDFRLLSDEEWDSVIRDALRSALSS